MSDLQPRTQPLDERAASRLLRRSAYGVEPEALARLVGVPAHEAAAELVRQAVDTPAPGAPIWRDQPPPGRGASQQEVTAYLRENSAWTAELRASWLGQMVSAPLRERMVLFWHNVLVTESPGYTYAVYATRYIELLRAHALGNFRTLIREIGLTPAMLRYLDGYANRAGAPNENYARELLELFTMSPTGPDGSANYSEADIRELSRALTGWQIDGQAIEPVFNPNRFDAGAKTLFGRSGAYGYTDALDVIFEERSGQIADYVARRLYRAFVQDAPDPALCAELASGLLADDFEIAPTLERLLGSMRFHDPDLGGSLVKSPVELALDLFVSLQIPLSYDEFASVERSLRGLSQVLLDPPSVAGWPGYRDWLTTSLLPLRWSFTDAIFAGRTARSLDFIPIVDALVNPGDPDGAFLLPVRLAERLFAIPIERVGFPAVDAGFAGNLAQHPIPEWVVSAPEHVRILSKMLLADLPWYEWSPYADGAGLRIAAFVQQLVRIPEYQLA